MMAIRSGWISVSRSLWDHDLFKREPMSEREAWLWMISNAAWTDTDHRVSGENVDVPRGTFVATLRELQGTFMWGSDTRVRNFLKKLSDERMIRCEVVGSKRHSKTHISICNYDRFQNSARSTERPVERTRNAAANAVNKQDNNTTKETTVSISARDGDDTGEAFAAYNDAAKDVGWPKAQQFTDARRKKLRARMSEVGGIAGWKDALAKAKASDFICGRNGKSWDSFNIDDLLSPSKLTKLIEGKYDNRGGASKEQPGTAKSTTIYLEDGWFTPEKGHPYEYHPSGEIRDAWWIRKEKEAEMYAAIQGAI